MEGLLQAFCFKRDISTSDDFDTLTERGVYRVVSEELSGNGAPPITYGFGSILIVDAGNNVNKQPSQIFIESNTAIIYTRRHTSVSWAKWTINK